EEGAHAPYETLVPRLPQPFAQRAEALPAARFVFGLPPRRLLLDLAARLLLRDAARLHLGALVLLLLAPLAVLLVALALLLRLLLAPLRRLLLADSALLLGAAPALVGLAAPILRLDLAAALGVGHGLARPGEPLLLRLGRRRDPRELLPRGRS